MADKPDWAKTEARKLARDIGLLFAPDSERLIAEALRKAYAAGYRAGQERMLLEAVAVLDRFNEPALGGRVLDIQIEEPPT